ncbi:tyrosine-type recombinase/integrase [Sphingomonas sp.]|uniref:tyrosine-type recombinase/integrase n=1 Tax=Sphingomonas sp. TaxID=28214 RepID=UPI003CC542B2
MPLTDVTVRTAKPGPKPIKLSDERGLFLLVQPSGGKLWRLKYRIDGKEKKLALGRYPDVGLKEARERSGEARKLLAAGVDPSEKKRLDRLDATLRAATIFKAVADEYIEKCEREGRADVTIGKARWLLSLLEPALGSRPVSEISPPELLAALKKVEARGHLETARRMRSFASRVFRYAVATARASADPAVPLRGALLAPKVVHHAAILEPAGVGALLRAIDGYEGQPMTQLALRLAPHVFVRPGELRKAEWEDIDFEASVWTMAASKMKMRQQPHRVPLSRQAVELLRSAQAITGRHRYVFASLYPGTRPMSGNTINAALRRLGYAGDEMTGHGFRTTASTLLNESGRWNPDAIERALSHKDPNGVRAAYHRGQHWAERVEMAQWWSDYLTSLVSDKPNSLATSWAQRSSESA